MLRRPKAIQPLRPIILPAIALAALCVALTVSGCKTATKSNTTTTKGEPDADAGPGEPDRYDPDAPVVVANYETIAERDVFRPLVAARKDGGGEAGQAGGEGGGGSGGQSQKPSGDKPPDSPPKPPDPTEDVALTGIIETTDGLEVLLENVKTGEGQFVGVGDELFGLRIVGVGPGVVTLTQGDTDYELKLGEKEITDEATAKAASSPAGETEAASKPSATGASSDMPDFRTMSSEQRRAYFENMSEDQREAFRRNMRERYGGGRGGPGGPGGRGGRGGRGPR